MNEREENSYHYSLSKYKLVLIMQVIIVKAISTNIPANSKKTVTDMPITID